MSKMGLLAPVHIIPNGPACRSARTHPANVPIALAAGSGTPLLGGGYRDVNVDVVLISNNIETRVV